MLLFVRIVFMRCISLKPYLQKWRTVSAASFFVFCFTPTPNLYALLFYVSAKITFYNCPLDLKQVCLIVNILPSAVAFNANLATCKWSDNCQTVNTKCHRFRHHYCSGRQTQRICIRKNVHFYLFLKSNHINMFEREQNVAIALTVTYFYRWNNIVRSEKRDTDVIDLRAATRFWCHTHKRTQLQFVAFDMVGSPMWALAIMARWHHTHNPQLSGWHTLHLHARFRRAHALRVRIHTPLCQA